MLLTRNSILFKQQTNATFDSKLISTDNSVEQSFTYTHNMTQSINNDLNTSLHISH